MKIAMIGHKRIPSRSGGIEVVVDELAVRMAAKGHHVTAYNRHTGEPPIKAHQGVRIVEIPTFRSSKLNAVVYACLATLHAIFCGYDVIHYHAEGPSAMIWLPKCLGIKTVATIHGLDWQRAKWGGFATWYLKRGEKVAAKYADRLIVLSHNMGDYFESTYGRKSMLIPNGIQQAKPVAPRIIKEKWGLEKRGYFLFLARLVPEKGLDTLLDAFKGVKTDVKLVVAGGLAEETEYIRSVKLKAEQDARVIMANFVSGELLAELYTNCLAYILPSDVEGMPLTLLEAMAHGARVVTSDIPECTEVAGDYGYVFQKGNASALRDVLCHILANTARFDTNFGKNETPAETERHRNDIVSRYDWEAIVNSTLDIYTDALSRHPYQPRADLHS